MCIRDSTTQSSLAFLFCEQKRDGDAISIGTMSSGTSPDPGRAGETEAAVQDALRRYMEHAPLPFAITRGAQHNLAYANAPFCQLAGIADGGSLGDPITSVFAGSEKNSLSVLLDRAFRGVTAVRDEHVYTSRADGTVWRCTAWPVVDSHGTVSYTHLRAHETPEHLVC